MQNENRMMTQPLSTQKTRRRDDKRTLTSGFAGKMIPLAVIPLLRQDTLATSALSFTFEMAETAELLLNAVHIETQAWFVPTLAFERFHTSLDALNRSYMLQPHDGDAGEVIPYVQTSVMPAFGASEFYKTLGIHAKPGTEINSAYLEAYNVLVNHRRKLRSNKLPMREMDDHSLAEAFWHHTTMRHIVPDFDQAMIDGVVPLNVVSNKIDIKGLVLNTTVGTGTTKRQEDDTAIPNADVRQAFIESSSGELPRVYGEMAENGITVSLSNIEMAKKTAAYARARKKFAGHTDDYVIDMLMGGIPQPEVNMSLPQLIGKKSMIYGMTQRYATDAGNLDQSATRGAARVSLPLRVPTTNTGGVIVVTAEITPEQLFERQKDYYFFTKKADEFPESVRDFLDPEKVEVVTNNHVDVDHSDPDSVFGYAPLNHMWQRQGPNVGGKYFRPEVDEEFDEDRQKIWAVETEDPELTTDFYLCTNMHHKVFEKVDEDPFEITGGGVMQIIGNTQFGAGLTESDGSDYEYLLAQIDQERIDKDEGLEILVEEEEEE